jgi:hypothetical protein
MLVKGSVRSSKAPISVELGRKNFFSQGFLERIYKATQLCWSFLPIPQIEKQNEVFSLVPFIWRPQK